ncbi:hypothetical protein [Natrinema versiforme]|uniref:Lipoprotein n=1 Tax=Natrinema versiforme JCM 10478 TaxID=1227496 RepID=L9Y760_9EURY|nr:hypothetical protein [Natrinema versiforme]ELY69522.1 hypothetical protein C489_04476 [Natrinema versiforme JCM 10478]
MNRRPFLQTLATGGTLLSAGCTDSLPFTTTRLDSNDVFEGYRFDETDLVVEFRDGVDIQRATLYESGGGEYETIERPGTPVRFPVVFPERLETRLSLSLRIEVETSAGVATMRVGALVHAYVTGVEPLPDGRARLEIENQADGPLLVRFVGIYGDVPNPTIDPLRDSFDRSSFDRGPGVVGVAANQRLSPSRTDLVVPSNTSKSFETTYTPFAFPEGTNATNCDGTERTGRVAVVHGSGGSAAYDFRYRLEGEASDLGDDGLEAGVCTDSMSGSE